MLEDESLDRMPVSSNKFIHLLTPIVSSLNPGSYASHSSRILLSSRNLISLPNLDWGKEEKFRFLVR